jgi:hypothetical protein
LELLKPSSSQQIPTYTHPPTHTHTHTHTHISHLISHCTHSPWVATCWVSCWASSPCKRIEWSARPGKEDIRDIPSARPEKDEDSNVFWCFDLKSSSTALERLSEMFPEMLPDMPEMLADRLQPSHSYHQRMHCGIVSTFCLARR